MTTYRTEVTWICAECDLVQINSVIRRAVNPFEPRDTICGCVGCCAVNSLVRVCDVAECERIVSGGWPDGGVWRYTCGRHFPDGQKARS